LIAGVATCGRTAWKTFLPFPRARTRQDDDDDEHEDIEHLGCWDGRRHDRDLPFFEAILWHLTLASERQAFSGEPAMDFYATLGQILELLQRQGRVSYRALKLHFHIDDDYLEGLKDELIEARRLAQDENGKRGRAEAGQPLLSVAWSIVDKSGQGYHKAELHRLKGKLLLQQAVPDAAQAEICFH
jgi:hypothetical protein